MIRQHTSFLLMRDPRGKTDHQAIHCPTANFGPLSRGSVTKPMLITVFDNDMTQSHQEPGFEPRPFQF